MTPERPRRADATASAVEPSAPQAGEGCSPEAEPSAPDRHGAPLYAALDLGTNSCRMLIAQPKGSQFRSWTVFPRPCSWAPGWKPSGGCRAPRWRGPSRRCASARRSSQKHGVGRMRLVATEACRRARNARDFIRQVRRETGLAAGDHRPRGRGAAGRHLLRAAGQPEDRATCWWSISAAARPSWSGSTCPRSRPERPRPRDHAAAHAVLARRATGRRRGWSTGSSVPLGVATLKDQFADVEDDARALCADELVLRGKPGHRSAPTTPRPRARGSRSSAPRAP